MLKDTYLQFLLSHWRQTLLTRGDFEELGGHLDDETCYLLTLPGALDSASNAQIAHLTSCPRCIRKWAEWQEAKTLAEDDQKNDYICSYGLLEAAAGTQTVEGITSRSVCGQFVLRIFPPEQTSTSAMITLEYTAGDPDDMEGKRFVVLEGSGRVLLDGRLRHGRLARQTTNFDKINLGQWTIIEEK